MKKLLIFLLCGVMLLSLTACKKEETPATDATDYKEGFVADDTVNRFLLDYKEFTQNTPQGLGLGELDGEYAFYVNMHEVRMLPTRYGLRVSIMGGKTPSDLEDMIAIFETICKASDRSCTDQQLEGAKDFMAQQTETAGDYRVCNEVKILAYTPIINVETVKLDCKLDLLIMKYLPVTTE